MHLVQGSNTLTRDERVLDSVQATSDSAPVFTSPTSFTVNENSLFVGTLTAFDADGDGLTYTIARNEAIDVANTGYDSFAAYYDGMKFWCNATTGALYFNTAPNYEVRNDYGYDNVYDVLMKVTDASGAYSFQMITINVANVNEGLYISSNGGGASAAFTINENQIAATTVVARDYTGSNVTYSITGGYDSSKFTIDAATGALTFVTPPNYEKPNDFGANRVYDVTVSATDGSVTDTQALAITIANVWETPVITSNGGGDTAVIAVPENSAGYFTTVTIAEQDNSSNQLTYAIVGGADAARFSIAWNGALAFVNSPDFEAPIDLDGNNVYDVIVQVSDGNGTDAQAISVVVNNINDAPIISSNGAGTSASISVAENQTAVTTVVASDYEGAPITYSISGGVDSTKFTINAATGVLSFVAAPNFEVRADNGANNVYDVIVRASDGNSFDTQNIAVTVTNVNEAPVITSNGGGDMASVTVNENLSSVVTVASTDPENTARSYSIVGGADASRFMISSATGALSFRTIANYENPLDADGNNVYEVVVRASDGSLFDTQTIAVTVADVNEAPVITSNGGGASASILVAENQTAVMTVSAGDPEAGALTYSISDGVDAARFVIGAASGVLSFVTAPDYEARTDSGANGIYDVIVRVTDGSLVDTQALAITIGNVNEAPIITSNGGGNTASVTVEENNAAVLTVTSTDPENSAQTYAISGGADAALFQIDGATGALSFVSAPNYENPGDANSDNVYDVTVSASDGSLTTTQAVQVSVTNTNEAVYFTSSNNLIVPETYAGPFTVKAVDPDGGAVTYSIAGGEDAALFTIDSTTGALSFLTAPNYETPSDANGDNLYRVTVRASDGVTSAIQATMVTVYDMNEAPVITSGGGGNTAVVAVNEGTNIATTIVAADPDSTAVTYSIVGGADVALFTIDAATGLLSFVQAPNYEAPLDADGNNAYVVTVRASDGALSDTQTLTVTVGNVDEAVTITAHGGGESAIVHSSENTKAVTTLAAVDPDGQGVSYSISGGADAARFTVDSQTGALSFINAPNREAPVDANGDNIYDVIVTATDGTTSDSQSLSVIVDDVDEAPLFPQPWGNWAAVGEGTTAVYDFNATDPEGRVLTFSINRTLPDDNASFTIDANTGQLSFVVPPDFEHPSSLNGNAYHLTVEVSDGVNVVSQQLHVAVLDVNEPISITSFSGADNVALTVMEQSTAVATVTAVDEDGRSPTYTIVGGADASLFEIGFNSGQLTFRNAPDREVPGDANGDNVYDVMVRASDGQLYDYQSFAITVGNVNEGVAFTSANSFAALENSIAVGVVSANDVDGDAVTYAISGGADASRFAIDAATGLLSFINAPNYEAPGDAGGNNVYDVVVTASDGTLSSSQAIAVTVGNANEGVEITSAPGFTMSENNTLVGGIKATDADGDQIAFSIAGGADAALFTIDATTGALSFINAPNFEAPGDAGGNNVYDVIVRASDGSLASTQAVTVTVGNVNEAVTITSNGGGNSASLSIAENNTAVTTVAATDIDGTAVSYSIVGGADAARFTINAQTGALSFLSAPNFEAPTDAGANNVYDVVVQASDGMLNDQQSLSVTVINQMEGYIITGTNSANTISTTTTVSGQQRATALEDTIYGLGGNDSLYGGGGNDYIDGGAGNDNLYGEAGADSLLGGTGADRFNFTAVSHSTVAAPDTILDFSRTEADKIVLSVIDANVNVTKDQAFSFIGTSAFSGVAGQLRYEQSGGNSFVMGDVNGDGVADFRIQVNGLHTFTATDFVL